MTMIRTLLCTVLLSVACQAAAGTLYRWKEPDGSLTFSPEPPPAGIAFDTVQTGGENLATQAGTAGDSNLAQTPATAAPQPATALPAEPEIKISAVPLSVPQSLEQTSDDTLVEAPQTLAYAPNTANPLPQGITAGDEQAENAEATSANNPNGVVNSAQKFEQCQELQKRVVSLERRLRSKLSSEDVDNTVVAMVRYQNSFDRHCE